MHIQEYSQLRDLQLPIKNLKSLSPCFFQGLTSLEMLSVECIGQERIGGEEEDSMYDDEVASASFLTQLSAMPLISL